MELLSEIAHRVSVRSFTDQEVEKPQVDRILEAGWKAPSAKNRQAWRFIAIRNKDTRRKLEEASYGQAYIGQAGLLVALCTTNIEYRMPNGELSYPVDLAIAGSFMMLQAEHEGLGTCLTTTYDQEDVKHILSIPYSMRIVMILAAGHIAEKPEPTKRFNFRRIASYEHW